MTIRTTTFDDEQWQVVPKNPAPAMIESGANEVISPLPTAGAKAGAVYIAMLAAAPEPPAQQPEPVRVWYMRDNHTFLELPLDIDEAISALRNEWPSGQTCGVLCSKEVNEEVHAHGEIEPFIAEVRAWYDRHGIGKGENK